MDRGNGVDHGAVRSKGLGLCRRRHVVTGPLVALGPLLVGTPVPAQNPAALREPLRGSANPFAKAGFRVAIQQVHPHQQGARAIHVHVPIVKAWGQESASEIFNAGLRPDPRLHGGVIAYGDDPRPRYGQGLGPGLDRIHGVDLSVPKHRLGVLGGARGTGDQNQKQAQGLQAQPILPTFHKRLSPDDAGTLRGEGRRVQPAMPPDAIEGEPEGGLGKALRRVGNHDARHGPSVNTSGEGVGTGIVEPRCNLIKNQ